jgi:hypothetical protein
MLLWQGRGQGGLVLMGVLGMMVIGLVRGVSMRLGGLLVIGMGGIRLGIRGEVGWVETLFFCRFLVLVLLIIESCI